MLFTLLTSGTISGILQPLSPMQFWPQCRQSSTNGFQIESNLQAICYRTTTSCAVAAPDHKIGQCIQRSALFPGRADGETHGSERFAGGAKRRGGRFGKGRLSPSPLGSQWVMPQKNFSKISFEIACFLHFCKLKWFHLQSLGKAISIGSNHTIPVIAT